MRSLSTIKALRWPPDPVDPTVAWVDYAVLPDEFLIYFGGKPVPASSDPVNVPWFRGLAVMRAIGPDDVATDEIVGVHVIPMLLGAVQNQPHWAVLAWAAMAGEHGTELLHERLTGFLAEVKHAVETYWTPAPTEEIVRSER